MSKFNLRGLLRTGTSPVASSGRPTGVTFEGAPGYQRDPKSELFLLAVTSLVAEDTYYETAGDRDARLRALVAQVAVADHDWTLRLVRWLRTGAHMRSVALVVAAEAVKARLDAGLAGGNRALIDAALDRADEPGEMLAYWASRYGRAYPKPVKRGVADGAVRLYSERALVKYDGDSRAFRFADVIELLKRKGARVSYTDPYVPVLQHAIRAEILRHLAEMRLQARLAPRAGDARLRIANDLRARRDCAGLHQRAQGQVRRRRIAARVRNEARPADLVAVEFRQAIDGLREPLRLHFRLFVPALVYIHRAQPERPAQIHHADPRLEIRRRQFHRNLVRRRQENHLDPRRHHLGR